MAATVHVLTKNAFKKNLFFMLHTADKQSYLCCTKSYSTNVNTKNWFSKTYKNKWNWAEQTPRTSEIDKGVSEENKLFIQKKELELISKSPLVLENYPRNNWNEKHKTTLRCGVIGIKIGVVPQWTVTGKKILCTMLQVLDNHVIDYKPPEVFSKMPNCKDLWKAKGYACCIVGAVSASPLEFSEEYNLLFENSGIPPKRKMTRFVITDDAAIAPGTPLSAQHFRVGDYVDVNARTINMGFQGVLTRWGMKGGRASHGVTKAHRRIGSIGGGGDKGGIWKGKKMPGHMGNRWRYHQGLQIVRINTKYNVLYVKGPNIPGPPKSYVRIMDTLIPTRRKLLTNNPPPMPTFFEEDEVPDTPENLYHESLFSYDKDFISYEGVDLENLFLHSKQYLLVGGTYDGKNHSYRRGIL